MYEDRPPWLSCKEGIRSAGIPASMSAEVARLATCELVTGVSDDGVNAIYQRVIEKLRTITEQGCALGRRDCQAIQSSQRRDGSAVYQSGQVFPLSFDSSGNMSGVVLLEQMRQGAMCTRAWKRMIWKVEQCTILFFRKSSTSAANGFGVQGVSGQRGTMGWACRGSETRWGRAAVRGGVFCSPLANTIDSTKPHGCFCVWQSGGAD